MSDRGPRNQSRQQCRGSGNDFLKGLVRFVPSSHHLIAGVVPEVTLVASGTEARPETGNALRTLRERLFRGNVVTAA
jgi:hypothetical protein